MRFYEILDEYLDRFGSSSKELSELSDISYDTISRYRRGVREPAPGSRQISMLANGLSRIAHKSGTEINRDDIISELSQALGSDPDIDISSLGSNLKILMDAAEISNTELARAICFDPSYISCIISGKPRPLDLRKFISDTACYISSKAKNADIIPAFADVFGCGEEELSDEARRMELISGFLGSRQDDHGTDVRMLLERVDEFDLDQYIKTLSLEDLNSTIPEGILETEKKIYYGTREVMQSELDFVYKTVASDSMQDIILYTDIPIEDLARDINYVKKFIHGYALLPKKGLHINIIHDMSRPTKEIITGLIVYIPMYMTGQITPYYFSEDHGKLFHHTLRLSGSVGLTGNGLDGFPETTQYIMTTDKNELRYYRSFGEQLLSKALPLMEIYTEDRLDEFGRLMNSCFDISGTRRVILSSPPLFTMDDELLEGILSRNSVSESKKEQIRQFISNFRSKLEPTLLNEYVYFQFPIYSRDEFAQHPVSVFLSEVFYEKNIYYTYEEYLAHVRDTAHYLNRYPKTEINTSASQIFRNIAIAVINDKYVVISKNRRPSIHFVIQHPKATPHKERLTA